MVARDGPGLRTNVGVVQTKLSSDKYEHNVRPRLLDARWARRSEGPIVCIVEALWVLIFVCTLLVLYLITYPYAPDDMKVENLHITGLHVALAASWLTWFVLLAVAFQFHGPWIPSSANDRRVYSKAKKASYRLIAYNQLKDAVRVAKDEQHYERSDDILQVVWAAAGLSLGLNGTGAFPAMEDFELA